MFAGIESFFFFSYDQKSDCVMMKLLCQFIHSHQSPVPPLRTTTFVLSKEGILGLWYLMNVHHLNCSLPFGFTNPNTNTKQNKSPNQYQQNKPKHMEALDNKVIINKVETQTIFFSFVVLLKPFPC